MTRFKEMIRTALDARGLLGTAAARQACAAAALARGTAAFAEIESLAGTATLRRALDVRHGRGAAEGYRYVLGYGELMTEFLVAPLALHAETRARVTRLGAFANFIVSYFDEMVDGGWPRTLLLPQWALAAATTPTGRVCLAAAGRLAPSPARLTILLVSEYFRRLIALPFATRHESLRRDVYRLIREMYLEEGRTPREWRRIRGTAAFQKKTALPLVVLGLPAWLARGNLDRIQYDRHHRWLIRLGKFIRWIDDAADIDADESAGASNLVLHALARREAQSDSRPRLAAMIARRGQWLCEEWRTLMDYAGCPEFDHIDVLATVLIAWLGEAPDAPLAVGYAQAMPESITARIASASLPGA